MSETTKEYFEREKQSRFDLLDYLDEPTSSFHKVELAQKIIWSDINDLLHYNEEDNNQYIDPDNQDRDAIDEAVRNHCEPLSIERRVKCNPYDSSIIEDREDSKYKIMITYGWPNVFREIDWTAELHLYRWSDHYSRDFGRDVADKLLSFYWLE